MSLIPWLSLATTLSLGCAEDPCPTGSTRSQETGWCTLDDTTGGATGPTGGSADGGTTGTTATDTLTGGNLGLTEGDPIEVYGSYSNDFELFSEFTGAAIIDDDQAILVGVSGFALANRNDGSWSTTWTGERSTRVDVGGDWAWVITGSNGFYPVDLSDIANPDPWSTMYGAGSWTYDVAATDSLVAIAYGADGVWLWRAADLLSNIASPIAVIDADDATAVDIIGDSLAMVDGSTLAMWDISDPTAPTQQDLVDLNAGGMDVAASDDWVAVGLGGSGVQAFSRSDAGLEEVGWFPVPGSATGVALDGDNLWAAAWGIVALARLTPDGVAVLGHEDATESAFGIDARDGMAIVADWFHSTALHQVDGVGGPEVDLAEELWFAQDEEDSERLEIRNYGIFDLTVDLSDPGSPYSVDTTTVTLAPGDTKYVIVDSAGTGGDGTLSWTSNDPDEGSGYISLKRANQSVGSVHSDFNLDGFTWPDPTVDTFSLADTKGKVTFLAYWATF
ncbi:MAG: hypothetical protein GXP62_20605 [Oligoflexia bacterium]|nr:hypothetical protein [Oligoflexia bacterium]